MRVVLGELPDLPFLPELPERGPHADLCGRTAALLADMPVDLQPTGWRLVSHQSRDGRRAHDLLSRDLDALEEATQGQAPPALKLQAAGPWTLAATLELTRGERVLADHGAVDDLAQSLAEGLRRQLADVATRLPGTRLVLQLDEPALPAVLRAGVPTASGFGRLRAPSTQRVREVLAQVLAVTDDTVVHCCAQHPPVELLIGAGAAAVSIDATLLTPRDDEALGVAVESGRALLLGVVPTRDVRLDLAATMEPVRVLWRRLGFDHDRLPGTVVVTPTCGLAGVSPGYARAALSACVEIARRLGEEPE
ncbi:MAG: methionine synthase [Frankiales bacterium]|nr:methionine synthase [Frankiales bacterium]